MYYLVKDEKGVLYFDNAIILEGFKLDKLKINILKLINEKPRYPVEIAKKLKMHEQRVYYHIKGLLKQGIIEVCEKKEIRGTIAKIYRPKAMNLAVSLSQRWKELGLLKKERDKKLIGFLEPFIKNGRLNCSIVVGSPDPHGPHKARARDGHYATELSLFLGNYCCVGKDFSVKLDVDANLNENMIVVGGPVTNLVNLKINDYLQVRFSDTKPRGISGKMRNYEDDSIGMITRIPSPFKKGRMILVMAGIRFIGTKAAIMAFTRYTNNVLYRFTGQKEFYCVVQGFDLDADGKIDSVEILE